MILSENQLKIPGKMYKVRVKCVSTRRLTTIEWLILSCTQKFNKSNSMSGKTLKYDTSSVADGGSESFFNFKTANF